MLSTVQYHIEYDLVLVASQTKIPGRYKVNSQLNSDETKKKSQQPREPSVT